MTQNKQREIITINCGGAGVNLGQNLLEQFAVEQGIGSSGDKECKTTFDSTIPISFSETSKGKYIARTMFTDLDPYSINKIKTRCSYNNLLHSDNLISGQSDASMCFSKGHYLDGKELIDTINKTLRTMVEACDNSQGFIFNHSISGGTGGGLGTLILERLRVDYRKKNIFSNSILYDSEKFSTPMEIYNALFTMHWLLDHTDVGVIFDNTQLTKLCEQQLNIQGPSYKNINGLITKVVSDLTATSRFAINEVLGSIHMDMVPFPRLHFLNSSIWPMIPMSKKNPIFKDDIQLLTSQCINYPNFMVKMADFDEQEDKNMAMSFGLRGANITKYMSQANASMQWMRLNRKFEFVEWTSDKPMVKFIDDGKPSNRQLKNDDILMTDKQVSMLMNNTCFARLFNQRINKRYDILYNQRCFVHHFIKHGMVEGEFKEAREDLGFLHKDYLDVLAEQATDSAEDSEDDY